MTTQLNPTTPIAMSDNVFLLMLFDSIFHAKFNQYHVT
jgi:hypothetical protein